MLGFWPEGIDEEQVAKIWLRSEDHIATAINWTSIVIDFPSSTQNPSLNAFTFLKNNYILVKEKHQRNGTSYTNTKTLIKVSNKSTYNFDRSDNYMADMDRAIGLLQLIIKKPQFWCPDFPSI